MPDTQPQARPGRPRPDPGPLLWLLAGMAGITAAAVTAASGRFDHLPVVAEVAIALVLGWLALLVFVPWRQVRDRDRDRREIRQVTRLLNQIDGDENREALGGLKSARPDELGELRRTIHDVLAGMMAHRLEAKRLRRTMAHSIRRETDRATGRLQREAETDPLTGLGNRRALDRRIVKLLDLVADEGRPLSVMVIDIDHFKPVNDLLGHRAGDECIAYLGLLLREGLRDGDAAFRTGGDEFIVLMPGADSELGKGVAERIRQLFGQVPWPHSKVDRPTLSIGVAAVRALDPADPQQLIKRADNAMYASKRAGRARTTTDLDLRVRGAA